MRRVLPLLAVLLLGFAHAPVPPYRPKPDTSKDDLRNLKGSWVLVSSTSGGKPWVMPQRLPGYTFHSDDEWSGPAITWAIKLDTQNRLKRIDGKLKRGDAPYDRFFGVYRLDADTLTVCLR